MRKLSINRNFWIAAACAVLVFVLAESFTAKHVAHAQTSFSPFTLRQETRMFDAKNDGLLIDIKTVARRSDGARVEIGHIFGTRGLQAGDNARKIALPDGEVLTAYDHLRAATRWDSAEARKRQRDMLFNIPGGCVGSKEQSIGKETIMGHETVAVVWPGPIEPRVTQWRALDLNCEALRARIEDKQPDGTYKVHNEISTVSLVPGEPDPTLFSVPQDYKDLKPSEIMHNEIVKLGGNSNPDLEKQAQQSDAQYDKYH